MFVLSLMTALGGPGQSGTLMPGARRIDPDQGLGWVAAGGIGGNVNERGWAGGGGLDFGVGNDLALIGHVSTWGVSNGPSGSIAALGLRAQLADTQSVRLAGVLGLAYTNTTRLHGVPGLAIELGDPEKKKVLFDLTLMPWSISVHLGRMERWRDRTPTFRTVLDGVFEPKNGPSRWTQGPILPLGTIGISVPVMSYSDADNRLRFGYPELIAWHHAGKQVFFDIGGVLLGETIGPHAKFGVWLGR